MKVIFEKPILDMIMDAVQDADKHGKEIQMIKLDRKEWNQLEKELLNYTTYLPPDSFRFREYNYVKDYPAQSLQVFGVLVVPEEESDE